MSELKMKPEHYQQMRDALTTIVVKLRAWAPVYQHSKLSPKRFRWDALNETGLRAGDSIGMKTGWPVYDYLDDTHIDSALRAVMREFNISWAAER